MGPVLWLTYIDTLKLDQSSIIYVDDLTISRPTRMSKTESPLTKLQEAVLATKNWCNCSNIILNCTQSVCVNISSIYQIHHLLTKMDNNRRSYLPHKKLLGIIIDEQLSFKKHAKAIYNRKGTETTLQSYNIMEV